MKLLSNIWHSVNVIFTIKLNYWKIVGGGGLVGCRKPQFFAKIFHKVFHRISWGFSKFQSNLRTLENFTILSYTPPSITVLHQIMHTLITNIWNGQLKVSKSNVIIVDLVTFACYLKQGETQFIPVNCCRKQAKVTKSTMIALDLVTFSWTFPMLLN
jgi:hypothetical protein